MRALRVLATSLQTDYLCEQLVKEGFEARHEPFLDGESMSKALVEYAPDVLVVRPNRYTKENADAYPALKLVIKAGAGYDAVDHHYCAQKGILAAYTPGKNACDTAELTLALMLAVNRRIIDGNKDLKVGKWDRTIFAKCTGVQNKTLGLIGFGYIGQLVLKRAKAFEMNILVYTRTMKPGLDEELGFEYCSLDDLLQRSDFVSLHIPIDSQTKGFINKDFLSKMKPNATLINAARGGLVNDADLLAHLDQNEDFWYGTDVYQAEPLDRLADFDNLLAKHPKVYGTPHIGAETLNSDTRLSNEIIRMIKKFALTGAVDKENCINQESDLSHLKQLIIRYHEDKEGILAFIFKTLGENELKVVSLDHTILKKSDACIMNVKYSGHIINGDKLVSEIMMNKSVIDVTL